MGAKVKVVSEIAVLHVDDDSAFTGLVSEMLESLDGRITVTSETDPTAAAATLENTSEYDCLVTDFQMPGMNGIELLESVRDHSPELPVVLFTGEGSERVASNAISAGVTDYLQKETNTDIYEVLANRIADAVSHKQAQECVRRQATAMDHASEGIATLDNSARYVEVNQKYADIHGTDPETLAGTVATRCIADEIQGELVTEIRALEPGEDWEGDIIAKRFGGEEFKKRMSIYRVDTDLYVVVAQDISEADPSNRYVRGDIEIAEEPLLHTITDPVFALGKGGRFAFVNRQFASTFDTTPSDILGLHFAEITAEPDVERAREAFEALVDSERETQTETHQKRVQTGTGDWLPVEVKMATLHGNTDIATVGVLRDISQRKQRLSELRKQNERLDEIAKYISHDMQTPLMTLQGQLELAQRGNTGVLDEAVEVVSRLQEMTESVSTLARRGWTVTDQTELSVATLIEQAWQCVDTGGASLEIAVDPGCEIAGNETQLRHAVENLFQNAVDHGESPQILVETTDRGLLIADDGPGLPADSDEIFATGYTTGDGTGLGLAHVARIVDAHGMSIETAESPLGGAGFEISTDEATLTTGTAEAPTAFGDDD